ncbi:trypsin-like peptidase domain-containing protein [Rhodococcus zopfii]|uniref:serine protease n=1 Tax=Rhodococcus zopfii TaxID=43772 RepID=UPI00148724FE|nr:serine protease [Rhodococcus zopfii]
MTTLMGSCLDRMSRAAAEFDWPAVSDAVAAYTRFLRGPDDPAPTELKQVLSLLRRHRRYEELVAVADSALGRGLDFPFVRRLYAQALVDRDTPAVALRLYCALAEDVSAPCAERTEARGGMGRCHKQLFLGTTDPDRRADHLRRALDAYLRAQHDAPGQVWHAINAAALLARADRDGIALPAVDDPADAARAGAAQVLEAVEGLTDPDAWAAATACEASVALGRHEDTMFWLDAFVSDPDADSFKIAALLRQLLEVWELTTTTEPGDRVLPLLRSALLHRAGGRVLVQQQDVGTTRMNHLEKVFGQDRYQSLAWYRHGLARCRAVAQICTPSEDGIGTGVLVDGADLHPDLPGRVLVTNGHVTPEALEPDDAVVLFHGAEAESAHRVVRRWWYDPSGGSGLDTTVLELDGSPPEVEPVPVAARMPALEPNAPRAYLIGHPRGLRQPQFSLQDNLVLDYDDVRVHYRSPTEGGSSGSPVFDDQWRLIGLHHAGGHEMPRLNHKSGSYSANEAITVRAIRSALTLRAPTAVEAG